MRGFNQVLAHALTGHSILNVAAAPETVSSVSPTAPGPNDVFKQGGDCAFSWVPDASGQWKETNVQLMSGDNLQMIPVTTVASFDGTATTNTSFTYPCPQVTPNSAIYFYQFSSPSSPTLTWTTRFTIAAADGSTTPPTNDTQPDGKPIPWGVGALVDQSKVVPPPAYLGGAAPPSTNASTAVPATTSLLSTSNTTTATLSSSSSSEQPTGVVTTVITSSDGAAPTGSANQGNVSGSKGNGAMAKPANLAFGAVALGFTAALFAVMT